MDWNIASCQSRISEADLPNLHQKAVGLLDLLQKNLPENTWERLLGISRKHTVFYTRFARLSCGEIRTTPCVKPQR
jgi:hypothetical protein